MSDHDGSDHFYAENFGMRVGVPAAKLGWSRDAEGNVLLAMTSNDWTMLLVAMGYAVGSAQQLGDRKMRDRMVELVDRLNVGNPNYQRYNGSEGQERGSRPSESGCDPKSDLEAD